MTEARASIRRCRLEEAEALLALWRQADAVPSPTDTPDHVRRVIVASQACVLVAALDRQLVGSIIGTFAGWRGNIYRIAVHPQVQRRGVAGALVREIERWLQGMGATRVNASVEKEHPWATAFWQAVGYGPEHHMLRYSKALEADRWESQPGQI